MEKRGRLRYIIRVTADHPTLLRLLKRHFGFDSFRPLQEEIINAAMAGRDVLALLPTGGGKSLCFQLPALARPGLTVVVSPLIALMKDQVDALQAAGIPATFLNSSLSPSTSRERLVKLERGEYKLLYVAPERLMLGDFLTSLARWNVTSFAIDEAHCISEWGHDFRPEYRQLTRLREAFPSLPLMALTATATHRVRDDILKQLKLARADCYVGSFNRPNLFYRVSAKSGALQQIMDLISRRKGEAGIIYCQARKTAEKLAADLNANGVRAAAYHAGIEAEQRSGNQDDFLRDKTQVICATIAFGMGINKPNVRFVIHYDLPKNIEGYYQETGRAGRDGLESECLLLFSPGDRIKYLQFIEEKADPKEREMARAHLELVVHFAEMAGCRRQYLLNYFGEEFPQPNCGTCDNCLHPRETWDGTVAAQKFLSTVFRIFQKDRLHVGVGHVVEVLTGANSEKIRKWGHEALTTYGIGKDLSREEWAVIGRELIRLGLLSQNPERFNALELLPEGMSALKTRQKIILTKAMPRAATARAQRGSGTDSEFDGELFEELRILRRKLAEARNVPPYIIFSDVSLRDMSRRYPQSEAEFSRISGVGDMKLREFALPFINEIQKYLEMHPRRRFEERAKERAAPDSVIRALPGTARESLDMFREGTPVEEIARSRKLTPGTIYGHLVAALEAGEKIDLDSIITPEEQRLILKAFSGCGFQNLTGAFELLEGRFPYPHLRLVRAQLGGWAQEPAIR